jgi:hypothetical protein
LNRTQSWIQFHKPWSRSVGSFANKQFWEMGLEPSCPQEISSCHIRRCEASRYATPSHYECYRVYWKCHISKHLPDATHVIWMLTHKSIPIFHGRIYDTCCIKLRACQGVRNELEMDKGHTHTWGRESEQGFQPCCWQFHDMYSWRTDNPIVTSNIETQKHRFQQYLLINKHFIWKWRYVTIQRLSLADPPTGRISTTCIQHVQRSMGGLCYKYKQKHGMGTTAA